MADLAVRPREAEAVRVALFALKTHFNEYFDRGWFAMVVDTLPIDRSVLRQIRSMLTLTNVYPEDVPDLRVGVRRLERFCSELKRYLMPVLRERLGVSGLLSPANRHVGTERIHRQLLCITFPGNLERLEQLTYVLHNAIDDL
jgi:hypothetical protein